MTTTWYELKDEDARMLMRLGEATLINWYRLPDNVQQTIVETAGLLRDPKNSREVGVPDIRRFIGDRRRVDS